MMATRKHKAIRLRQMSKTGCIPEKESVETLVYKKTADVSPLAFAALAEAAR